MEYRLIGRQLSVDVVRDWTQPGLPPCTQTQQSGEDLRRWVRSGVPPKTPLVTAGYQLSEILGRGGMGMVFRGRHLSSQREVAVKVLDIDEAEWRWAVMRFLREARLASRVRHENVIDIFEFGTTPAGVVYIAMELLDGCDLRSFIRQQRASWPWALHIMRQVCSGLAAIHDAGIVHRDLKPSNCFFVHDDETVKILDFGIATCEHQDKDDDTTLVLGTPESMAPEQIRGRQVDRRADVYAAGILLFELLAGRPPFQGPSVETIFDQHLNQPPPRLSMAAPEVEVPPGLEAIITRALAKNPDHRFSSPRELAAALEALSSHGEERRREWHPARSGSFALRRFANTETLRCAAR